MLALFGPTRFTAIVAGVVYAAPAAIKLVADGVKAVPATTVEASRSTGTTAWQEITKVQLPMATAIAGAGHEPGSALRAGDGGDRGLVGAGALGYDIVLGFSRSEEWGKGAAAGLTIVLLGIMVDRIAHAASDAPSTVEPDPRQWWRPYARSAHNNRPTGRKCPSSNQQETRMTMTGRRSSRVVALAACLVLALSACGSGGSIDEQTKENEANSAGKGDCGEFNLAVNPWVGYEADAYVVGTVAEQKLGCKVNYKDLKEDVSWQGFGTGDVDAVLEDWGHPDLEKKYFAASGDGSAEASARPATSASSTGTCRRGSPRRTRTSWTTRT